LTAYRTIATGPRARGFWCGTIDDEASRYVGRCLGGGRCLAERSVYSVNRVVLRHTATRRSTRCRHVRCFCRVRPICPPRPRCVWSLFRRLRCPRRFRLHRPPETKIAGHRHCFSPRNRTRPAAAVGSSRPGRRRRGSASPAYSSRGTDLSSVALARRRSATASYSPLLVGSPKSWLFGESVPVKLRVIKERVEPGRSILLTRKMVNFSPNSPNLTLLCPNNARAYPRLSASEPWPV